MRLRSQVWVQAYLRACHAQLISAAVVRHGDDDAGAIYIKVNYLDGTAQLFGPAPAVSDDFAYTQSWTAQMDGGNIREQTVDDFLHQQERFDSDLWIIEVEDKHGRHCLGEWLK